MDMYKPGYLGKVIPADDQKKLNDFVTNKFDAFNKVYDACKSNSEQINDIKAVETSDSTSLSVAISASEDTINDIKQSLDGNVDVSIASNVITAKS